MKICISTLYNNDFKDVAAITLPVMHEYCLRHGYSFHARRSDKDSPAIIWERVDCVMAAMGSHDLVVQMDADVLITNLTKGIPDRFDIGFSPVVVGSDVNGINDGVCIWNNSSEAALILGILASCKPEMGTCPQDMLRAFDGVLVYNQRAMNSYLAGEYGNEPNDQTDWQLGDFVLHLPGRSNERRIKILKEIEPLIAR